LVTCHLSLVTCHLSLVTCHLSLVTCHLSGSLYINSILMFFMLTNKLMLIGGVLSSLSIHQYTVEMASYNAPKNELRQYKLLDKAEEKRCDNWGEDKIFGREFYL
ncbi:hypothetical protein NA256_23425, partial [Salmonella sp. NW805]|uniref:hypothetical protein n=1 Tax=unclassified Salmonella TaxID=2614656 RepID=UPI003F435806